jgi:hypothetical protein
MFCSQCGLQAEQQTKFCRTCGSRLPDPALLLSREAEDRRASREDALSEVRLLKGVKSLVTGLAFLPLSIALVVISLSQSSWSADLSLIIAISLLFLSLCFSSRGLINLFKSGFFKTLKKRLILAEAALLNQPDVQSISGLNPSTERSRVLPTSEMFSISEHTTRDLQHSTGDSGKIG